tara:strand:- start:26 stop:232 length:207 start_codon:yes stop_codon:yes gene_type:complete
MTEKELINLSNSLNNFDLARLVELNHERFFVYVERQDGSHCEPLCTDVPTCINGNSVQINIQEEKNNG